MRYLLWMSLPMALAFAQGPMDAQLNLSVEQKAKIKSYRAELKACKEKTQMKILSVLNDEQKIKYLQMRQEKKANKTKKGGLKIEKVKIAE